MTPGIYFLACDGHIKIGTSRDVRRRSRALSNVLRGKASLLGSIPGGTEVEAALHKALGAHRVAGEWFHDNSEVRGAVTDLIERIGQSGEGSMDRSSHNWAPKTINEDRFVLEARDICKRLVNQAKASGLSTEEAINKVGLDTGVGGGVVWKFRYRSPLQVTAAEMESLRAADALNQMGEENESKSAS